MYKKMRIWVLFIILLSLCRIGEAGAWRDIVEYYLTIPVSVALENNQTATGFYIVIDKVVFFVTARHAFLVEAKDNTFNLASNTAVLKSSNFGTDSDAEKIIALDLSKLYNNGCIIYNKLFDIAVIKIADFIDETEFKGVEGVVIKQTPGPFNLTTLDYIKKYEETLIGNEVFVFGYPTTLGIQEVPQIDFSKPLVRKGIIAGKNEKTRTIILDCPVDFGNSGSPVLECKPVYEGSNLIKECWLIGIVTKFVPFVEETVNMRYKYSNYTLNNSGYSVITPIDIVLEMVRQNKIVKIEKAVK